MFAQSKEVANYATPEMEEQVEALLQTMSLEEKLAQITGTRLREIMVDGKLSLEKCREHIPHGIGHFCQFSSGLTLSPEELRDLVREIQQYLVTETRTKIPAIFHEEAITGFATQGATTFPQQIGVGCSWNPEIVRNNARSTAQNMRAAGATLALSPMLDLSRTAHWNRLEESYGEDAYLTSKMGVAFVRGLQGDDFKTGVAATVKHFAGYGTFNNNEKELYEEYLMPHEAAIKIAGAKSVMPSYGKYKALPVVANPTMLDQMLRKEIGFDGLVVSDYFSVSKTYKGYKQAPSEMIAGAMAINAGVDVELASPIAYPLLPEALQTGDVSMETIDAAVKRSLLMKAKLGLLDKDPVIGKEGTLDFDPLANRKLAYETAVQSIVLLKNNGILPLSKKVKTIALVGPNAATVHGLLGDYTYQSMISFWHSKEFDPTNPKLVTLKEGLENRLNSKVKILHERGCDWSAPLESKIDASGLGDDRLSKLKLLTIKGLPQPDLQRAIKFATQSDVIIAAMGENLYLCGEGRERKGIRLPGSQEAFVEQLLKTGKPVILVMFGGRQQLVSKFEDRCAGIIQAWFPGEEGGNAVADIITGKVNPSAKLCVTYPKTESKAEINYKNGYPDQNLVQYPFGYGLSYTDYTYSDLKINSEAKITDQRITMSFKVKNTGKVKGTEIVQLYISPLDTQSTMKPIQLKGFQRVSLKPKEEKVLQFKVSPQQFAEYKNSQWVIEPGLYKFMIAASSTDVRLESQIALKGPKKVLENGRSVFFALTE
ncbi:glycoside hydrolase family 3 C-terminal domain-containing protein [Aquimarina sp. ERC-38]|uniref:glycoside hydrolase family 3 N-terminal domain-containing protein n=1 Tax=Aquimarina sp. ERC-38 TaxID=2949996 RepID=UPI002245A99D|nr:glycoside hydrolase family 3 N-terminal domain-containing protein [Aquimarina sp. ERC-38]UZO82293.1 glycoside hydrolase family 3 C-terminal domain-containing protein [Aquimarina sp. ERC-38]